MRNCPNCGSSAQVKLIDKRLTEENGEVNIYREYVCGCGERFETAETYVSMCNYEDVIWSVNTSE